MIRNVVSRGGTRWHLWVFVPTQWIHLTEFGIHLASAHTHDGWEAIIEVVALGLGFSWEHL